jgi:hypothetical protein
MVISKTFAGPALEVNPFVTYVTDMYKNKRETTGLKRDFYKLMLNGLYGKFGEIHKTKSIYAPSFDPAQEAALLKEHGPQAAPTWKPISQAREDGYWSWQTPNGGRANNSLYSWAAYIAARARVINWQTQMQAWEEHDTSTFYTDTDSFLVDQRLPAALVGDELGMLKAVKTQVRAVWGAKHYLTDEGLVLKGVRRRAVPKGEAGFTWPAVTGVRSAIHLNTQAGIPREMWREPTGEYVKRQVLEGGETLPVEVAA